VLVKYFATFDDFWVFYVRQHKSKLNRTMHVVGTTAAMALVVAAVVKRRAAPLLLAPLAGYGLAWTGHLLFEKNLPTSFSHPIWAARAGLEMWLKTLTGQMDAELARCLAQRPEANASAIPRPNPNVN
jgi:hypothetical protein